jgi:cysteine desulfurase family protein (TIGR01976 family)
LFSARRLREKGVPGTQDPLDRPMTVSTGQTPLVASTTDIRSHFPALQRRYGGHAIAYFDGPGGTQVPRGVVEAMSEYLYKHNANTHWAYPTSAETDATIAAGREAMADFLNASPSEIAFGANMTTLTFHLARALGRGYSPGDEVVVTELDHHANVDPWMALAQERGVTVRKVAMRPETGQLDWDDFKRLLSERTRLVALGAASNALGTINDVKTVAQLAHDIGATVFVDAVHYAAHRLVDVRDLGCDFLACSAYKFYGPHIGVLYGKHERLQSLDVPKLRPAPEEAPDRFETGTQNHEGIAGAAAAIDFLASLAEGPTRRARLERAFHELHERGLVLISRLWEALSTLDPIQLYGPAPAMPRTPTVSFSVEGQTSDEVCRRLAEEGLFASHGDFYATSAVERLGRSPDGLVRIGFSCYSTHEEVERLIEAVQRIALGT